MPLTVLNSDFPNMTLAKYSASIYRFNEGSDFPESPLPTANMNVQHKNHPHTGQDLRGQAQLVHSAEYNPPIDLSSANCIKENNPITFVSKNEFDTANLYKRYSQIETIKFRAIIEQG